MIDLVLPAPWRARPSEPRRGRRFASPWIWTLFALPIGACSEPALGPPAEPARSDTQYLEERSGTSGWRLVEEPRSGVWRELESADGQRVTLRAPPRRIVSQSLAADEVLVDLIDRERIVAVTAMATDPLYSSIVDRAQEIGTFVVNSSERILALRPDLVFVTTFSNLETVEQLRRSGAPVLRLGGYESLAAIEDNIRVLAFATGADERGERLIEEMHRRIESAVAALPAGRHRWRVLSYTDGTVWSARTLFDEVVTRIGAVNIASEAGLVGWPRVGLEQVLAWQPEVFVIGAVEGQEERAARDLLALPGLAETPAGRAGRVVVVPNRLFSTVSHHIAGFVEHAARALAELEPPTPIPASS